MESIYTHRFLARLIIEAKTPLAVGSGDKDITTDALVATDANGLPYIPGTAIAGVVRHFIGEDNAKRFFGIQNKAKKSESKGSEIIFSNAKILNSKSEVVEGLQSDVFDDPLLKHYKSLPIRQHVKINAKGTAKDKGKFDNQVCFAGTRFCFEIEMVAKPNEAKDFKTVLDAIKDKTFRIGGGTRKGCGEITIVDLQEKDFDFEKGELEEYLKISSDLNSNCWDKDFKPYDALSNRDWIEETVKMKAQDFFLFGSGIGDEDVDITPVKGSKVLWTKEKGELKTDLVLIPATSIKGALAHRTAYHWNRLNKIFIGGKYYKTVSGDNIVNPAVKVLFGYEENHEEDGKQIAVQKRGNVLISDIIENSITKQNENTQVHVAIDRFTGGAKSKSGALFTEKNIFGEEMQPFEIRILKDTKGIEKAAKEVVDDKRFPEPLKDGFLDKVNAAFEAAVSDLKKGLLPLGGGTSRGNGIFVES